MLSKPTGLTALSAVELRRRIRERSLSSVEVIEAHLRRIDNVNPIVNAFCTVTADEALDAARAADAVAAAGAPLGVLHGLPVALKDLTPTKGVRTTMGSKLYARNVPQQDALLVRRIVAAGGIVIGKTNTPEFGHKGVTDNLVFGATRNPWNLERTPGGSSGGSAAAVIAGMVPLAEGSDGAGSIRIPASLCGVFGFKPTWGRVPDVMGAFSSHSPFFHNGPMARSVADAALLYDAIAGDDISDPFSVPNDPTIVANIDAGVQGLRIAYSPDLGYFDVSSEVREATRRAAELLGTLGCRVEQVDLPFDRHIEHAFKVLWQGRMVSRFADLPPAEIALLEPQVVDLIDQGRQLSALEYCRANLVREQVWNELLAVHRRFDLLVCPTTAVTAFPLGVSGPAQINGRAVDPLLGWFLTYPFNLTGNPAASVPCGFSKEGLPIGLQVVGRHLEDGLVLRACRALERASPWPVTVG